MKLQGLVLGDVGKMVRNENTLNAMARAGHIIFPVHKGHPYVNHEHDTPRVFEYKYNKYKIEYMDGCFYPFVVKY